MFRGLYKRQLLRIVTRLFGDCCPGRIGVLGESKLVQILEQQGYKIVPPSSHLQPLALDPLPLADGALSGLVVCDAQGSARRSAFFCELGRVVHHRGQVVVIDRTEQIVAAGAALCGGLTDIRQQMVGRWVVTSGTVVKVLNREPIVKQAA